MKHASLRRRLLVLIGAPVVALWLAAGVWLGTRIAHETREMFDRELVRTAASVLAVAGAVPGGALANVGSHALRRQLDDHGKYSRADIVLRDRTGRVLLDRSSVPVLAPDADGPFRTIKHGGHGWRVYQQWDPDHRYWIQLAVPLHDRDQLFRAYLAALLIPGAILLVLLPLLVWLGLRMGLAPLRAVSRAIAARPEHPLPLTQPGVPTELLELTRTVDSLVARLDSALGRERRFTSDAAHELRHPLAVLRMELDLAGAEADAANRARHLEQARGGLERMERMVGQLLTLARVEHLDRLDDAGTIDAAALARNVMAEASERAAPRDVSLALHAEGDAPVYGSAGLLALALRNLVDNAVLHGRRGGEVSVAVTTDDGHVEWAVSDDGPGVPPEVTARLGERFVRGDGLGSGLGLSIAQAIARLHGGGIEIGKSGAGGARIVFRVPASPAAARGPGEPAAGVAHPGAPS